MNYKELFHRARLLLSSPAKAWEEIGKETDGRQVLSTFVYPLIGLCGLSFFIGAFIYNTEGAAVFPVAMTRCCGVFVSLFGGYFLSVYVLERLHLHLFHIERHPRKTGQLVGYSMVVTFVLDIVNGLFSISILFWILQLYAVLIVFEGARALIEVEEAKLTRYTLSASVVIIACPAVVRLAFNELSAILH